jgi:hypothetical protein
LADAGFDVVRVVAAQVVVEGGLGDEPSTASTTAPSERRVGRGMLNPLGESLKKGCR